MKNSKLSKIFCYFVMLIALMFVGATFANSNVEAHMLYLDERDTEGKSYDTLREAVEACPRFLNNIGNSEIVKCIYRLENSEENLNYDIELAGTLDLNGYTIAFVDGYSLIFNGADDKIINSDPGTIGMINGTVVSISWKLHIKGTISTELDGGYTNLVISSSSAELSTIYGSATWLLVENARVSNLAELNSCDDNSQSGHAIYAESSSIEIISSDIFSTSNCSTISSMSGFFSSLRVSTSVEGIDPTDGQTVIYSRIINFWGKPFELNNFSSYTILSGKFASSGGSSDFGEIQSDEYSTVEDYSEEFIPADNFYEFGQNSVLSGSQNSEGIFFHKTDDSPVAVYYPTAEDMRNGSNSETYMTLQEAVDGSWKDHAGIIKLLDNVRECVAAEDIYYYDTENKWIIDLNYNTLYCNDSTYDSAIKFQDVRGYPTATDELMIINGTIISDVNYGIYVVSCSDTMLVAEQLTIEMDSLDKYAIYNESGNWVFYSSYIQNYYEQNEWYNPSNIYVRVRGNLNLELDYGYTDSSYTSPLYLNVSIVADGSEETNFHVRGASREVIFTNSYFSAPTINLSSDTYVNLNNSKIISDAINFDGTEDTFENVVLITSDLTLSNAKLSNVLYKGSGKLTFNGTSTIANSKIMISYTGSAAMCVNDSLSIDNNTIMYIPGDASRFDTSCSGTIVEPSSNEYELLMDLVTIDDFVYKKLYYKPLDFGVELIIDGTSTDYLTIALAMENVGSATNFTIKLKRNIVNECDITVTNGKNATFDLYGYTWNCFNGTALSVNNATVTINDTNGVGRIAAESGIAINLSSSSLNIYKGYVISENNSAIYAYRSTLTVGETASSAASGNIKIISKGTTNAIDLQSNSTFTFNDGYVLSASGLEKTYDSTSTGVTINENNALVKVGMYFEEIKYLGKAAGSSGTVRVNDVYYDALATAFEDLTEEESTLTLLSSFENSCITVSSTVNVTIDLNGRTWECSDASYALTIDENATNSNITITDNSDYYYLSYIKGKSGLSTGSIYLNALGTTLKLIKGLFFNSITVDSGKLIVGDTTNSTVGNLRVLNKIPTGYVVNINGTASFEFNNGFIGTISTSKYAYNLKPTIASGTAIRSQTTAHDNITYYGKYVEHNPTAVAHIGSNMYYDLESAIDELDSTTTVDTTIVLDGNVNECITISSTKIGTIDLNGKTWASCYGVGDNTPLTIYATSTIVITNNSTSIGKIGDGETRAIYVETSASNTILTIKKGIITGINSSGTNNTLNIGDSDSTTDNLQIVTTDYSAIYSSNGTLNINNGKVYSEKEYAIDARSSNLNVYKGVIFSKSTSGAIEAGSSGKVVNIGDSSSTVDNLKIISTQSSCGINYTYASGSFTFAGGFITGICGNVVTPKGYSIGDATTTYDGVTYTGKSLVSAVISIGSTKYLTMEDAINALDTTNKTILLETDINECTTIDTTGKIGTIDLNGKTWTCESGTALEIKNNITLTITDSSSSGVGVISSLNGSAIVFSSTNGGKLNIYKGYIISDNGDTVTFTSGVTLTVGNSESTIDNLRILSSSTTVYAVKCSSSSGSFNFYGGFIGSTGGYLNAYNCSAVIPVNKATDIINITYNSTTYAGRTIVDIAAQIGTTNYGSLSDALNALTSSSQTVTVKLMRDVTECVSVTTKAGIIDLNGHHWSCTSDSPTLSISSANIYITDSASGGSIHSVSNVAISFTGTIAVYKGIIISDSSYALKMTSAAASLTLGSSAKDTSTIQILGGVYNSGSIMFNSGFIGTISGSGLYFSPPTTPNVTLVSDTVTSTINSKTYTGVKAVPAVAKTGGGNYSSIESAIKAGGNITLLMDTTECVSINFTTSTNIQIDLNGKTWSCVGTGYALSLTGSTSVITILDSTESKLGKMISNTYVISTTGPTVKLYSGTFVSNTSNVIYIGGAVVYVGDSTNHVPEYWKLKILSLNGTTAGVYKSSGSFYFYGGFIKNLTTSSVSSKGSSNLLSASVAYDGTTYSGTTVAAAHIGGTSTSLDENSKTYRTLAAAINSISSSTATTVYLDYSVSECITIGSVRNITIDLKSYTWSCSGSSALKVSAAATITITSTSGTITSSSATIVATAGTINLYKGVFASTSTTESVYVMNIQNATLNIGDSSSTTSNLQITSSNVGGAIYATNATITINNGRIYSSAYKTIDLSTGTLKIYKGIIQTNATSSDHDAVYVHPATLTIGNSSSTTSNLQIISNYGAALYTAGASKVYIYTSNIYSMKGKAIDSNGSTSIGIYGGEIGSGSEIAIQATDTSYITITNGLIQTSSTDSSRDAIYLKSSARLYVGETGESNFVLSNITIKGNAGRAMFIQDSANATLRYGLILSSKNDAIYIAEGATGTLTVGNIYHSTKENLQILTLSTESNMYGVYKKAGTFNFIAGFIGAGYGYTKAYNSTSSNTGVIVTSETVNYNGTAYKGKTPAVAKIGSTYYASMYRALMSTKGLSSSKQIDLYTSFTESVTISENINAVINLNGKTWTGDSNTGFVLSLGYTAKVTITSSNSNSEMTVNYTNGAAILLSDYSELTILGGNIYGNGNVVRVRNNAKLTIGNGTNDYDTLKLLNKYTGSDADYKYAVYFSSNTGSTFTYKSGFVGSKSGSSSNFGYAYKTGASNVTYSVDTAKTIGNSEFGSYYGKSFSIVSVNNSYYYGRLAIAFRSHTSGTIKLLYNSDEIITIEGNAKNITIDLNGKTWNNTDRVLMIDNASSITITDNSGSYGVMSSTTNAVISIRNTSGTSSLKIIKGVIYAKGSNSAIWIKSGASNNLTIGVLGTSNVNNLKVISKSTTDYAINHSTAGTNFNFNGGFLASKRSEVLPYSGTPVLPVGDYAVGTESSSYSGTTYEGYTVMGKVAEIGSTAYGRIKDALLASESGTIKLYTDVNECVTLSSVVTKTIDLNGKTWSCSGTTLTISAAASITITDNTSSVGTMTATVQVVAIGHNVNATLKLYKGIFKTTSTDGENEAIEAYTGAKVTIGNSSSTTTNLQILSPYGGAAIYSSKATVVINNGLIQSDTRSALDFSGGTLNIYKGIIKTTSTDSSAYAIYAHPATITIGDSSSTIENLQLISNEGYSIRVSSSSTAKINAGLIYSKNWHGIFINTGSSAVIGDTSFTTSANLQILAGGSSWYGLYLAGESSSTVSAKINAGFLGSVASSGTNAYSTSTSSYSTLTINGAEKSENYSYGGSTHYGKGIYAVEKGDGNYYNTLAKAISSSTASKGAPDTIKIRAKELLECVSISSTKYLTIDLNGTTWNCSKGSAYNLSLTGNSSNFSEITITDNSGSIGSVESSYRVFYLAFAGKLNIYKGKYSTTSSYVIYDYNGAHTLTIGNTSEGSSYSNLQFTSDTGTVIYNNSTSSTSIIINAGSIRSSSSYAISNVLGKITINGGTITSTKNHAIYASGSSSTTIVNSGDITAYKAGIYAVSSAKVTINGGYITGRDDELASTTYGVYAGSGVSLTITGGSLNSNTSDNSLYMTGATATITGGSLNNGILAESSSNLVINGGYISSSSGHAVNVNASTLNVYKGTISASSSANEYRAIYTVNSTVVIGDSTSTIDNLRILRDTNGVSIWISGGTTTITRGLIYSAYDHGVHIDANGIVTVGDSSSTGSNLQIISSRNSSGYYGVSAGDGATLTYNRGFLGSVYTYASAYYKNATNATVNVDTTNLHSSTIEFGGTRYYGKIITSSAVASIGSLYYDALSNAINYLNSSTSTSTTVKLLTDVNECITISKTRNGTIDLNGKTWTCGNSSALYISGSSNTSSIIITDSSSIGTISGEEYTINLDFKGTLKIYKGTIRLNSTTTSSDTIYVNGNNGGTLYLGQTTSSSASNVIVIGSSVSGTYAVHVFDTRKSTSYSGVYSLIINSATISGYTAIRTCGQVSTTIYRGLITSTGSDSHSAEFVRRLWAIQVPTVVIGDNLSTSSNLRLLTSSTTAKGMLVEGYSIEGTINNANLTIYGGFISNGYTTTTTNETLYGKEVETTISITGTSFSGVKFVVAEVDSTQYETLKDAFSSIGTTQKTLKLLSNRNENVTFDSKKNVIIDLQGFTWSSGSSSTLYSSYTGTIITIKDTSSSVGTITSTSSSTISICGNLTVLKGNIIATASSGYSAIYVICSSTSVTIGTSAVTNTNDQIRITSNFRGISAPAPYTNSTVTVYGGYISGSTSGIYLSNSYGYIYKGTIIGASSSGAIRAEMSSSTTRVLQIGDETTTAGNLKIVNKYSGYGVYVAGYSSSYTYTFRIYGGFMGSAGGSTYAYSATNAATTIYGKLISMSLAVDGTSYSGQGIVAATIQTSSSASVLYCYTLQECFNQLPSSGTNGYPIISLLADRNESVNITSTKYGTFDLAGYSHVANRMKGYNIDISSTSSNTSNITITDSSTTRSGAMTNGYSCIQTDSNFSGTLTLLKGRFVATYVVLLVKGAATVVIGDSNSSEINLLLTTDSGSSSNTIYLDNSSSTSKATLTINGGSIFTAGSGTGKAINATNTDVSIYNANITAAGTGVYVEGNSTLLVGQEYLAQSNSININGTLSTSTGIEVAGMGDEYKIKATINRGTISGGKYAISTSYANLDLKGGTISSDTGKGLFAQNSVVDMGKNTNITHYLTITASADYAVHTVGSQVNIYNGIFKGNVLVASGYLTIYRGTIEGHLVVVNSSALIGVIVESTGDDEYYSSAASLQVLGGIETVTSTVKVNRGFIGNVDTVVYSGATALTIDDVSDTEKFATTYTYNSTTYNGFAIAVVHIGSNKYYSIASAIAAASSGNTITLVGNIDEYVSITGTKNLTFDLNGKILTCITSGYYSCITPTIYIYSSTATYTITDISFGRGLLTSITSHSIRASFAGTLKILKGTIRGISIDTIGELVIGDPMYSTASNLHIIQDKSGYYAIEFPTSSSSTAKFTYNGGFIGYISTARNYVYKEGLSNITYDINGLRNNVSYSFSREYSGKTVTTTFYGYKIVAAMVVDLKAGGAVGNDSGLYETLNEAFEATQDSNSGYGYMVRLLANRKESVTRLSSAIYATVDLNGYTWTYSLDETFKIPDKSKVTITDMHTDTDRGIGSIIGGGLSSGCPIEVRSEVQLTILKGIIKAPVPAIDVVGSGSNIVIGDDSSTIENLQIIGSPYAIYGTSSNVTLVINRGLIYDSSGSAISGFSNLTAIIGNSTSSVDNLQIIGSTYGITASGTFTFNGGFIGSTSRANAYVVNANTQFIINGALREESATYKTTTYLGYTVAIAHVDTTYFNTLKLAYEYIRDNYASSNKTIVLDGNPNECLIINSTIKAKIDLNGKSWTCSNYTYVLEINGDSSNTSTITITDNNSTLSDTDTTNDVLGTIHYTNMGETICLNANATLNVLKANIIGGSEAIDQIGGIVNIGDSSSNIDNLKITGGDYVIQTTNGKLNVNTGHLSSVISGSNATITIGDTSYSDLKHLVLDTSSSSPVISASNSTIQINRGLIIGWIATNGSQVTVGDSTYSTIDNLQIIRTDTATAVSTINSSTTTFTFNGGFIGNCEGEDYPYSATNVVINGIKINSTITYNGKTHSGITLATASVEGNNFARLQDAFDYLKNNYAFSNKSVVLQHNVCETVVVNEIVATLDLNGKKWTLCSDYDFYQRMSQPHDLLTIESNSNLTITDNSDSIGEFRDYYPGATIFKVSNSILNVYKGLVGTNNILASGTGTLNFGSSETTEDNLHINAFTTSFNGLINIENGYFYIETGIKINNGELQINGGTVEGGTAVITSNSSKVTITKGTIIGRVSTAIYANEGTTLVIGNEDSTPNNLRIVYKSTYASYAIKLTGSASAKTSFTFKGGFIGTGNNTLDTTTNIYLYPYEKNKDYVTYNVNGATNWNMSIDDTSIYGVIVAVARIDSTFYNTLNNAFKDINENTPKSTTIVLLVDIHECISIATTKIGTLDLNGKTWNDCGEYEINNLSIYGDNNESDITITDNSSGEVGTIINNSEAAISVRHKGKIYINRGNIDGATSSITGAQNTNIIIGDDTSTTSNLILRGIYVYKTTLTINNGTITRGSAATIYAQNNSTIYINKGYMPNAYIWAQNNCIIYIGDSNTTTENLKMESTDTLISIESGTILSILGGYFDSNNGIKVNASKLDINGGTIKAASAAIVAKSNSWVTIAGGNIESTTTYAIDIENSKIDVQGGTITGADGILDKDSSKINISDGTIIGTNGYAVNISTGEFNYTGGVLKAKKKENLRYTYNLNDGKATDTYEEYTTISVIDGEEYYVTSAVTGNVAIVKTTEAITCGPSSDVCKTFSDALNLVGSNDVATIALLSNITLRQINLQNKNILLDLHGYELNSFYYDMSKFNGSEADVYDFINLEDSTLKIDNDSSDNSIITYGTSTTTFKLVRSTLIIGSNTVDYNENNVQVIANDRYVVDGDSDSTFIFNNGSLTVNTSNSNYRNIYTDVVKYMMRENYHVKKTHTGTVHKAILESGSIIDKTDSTLGGLDIEYKEVYENEEMKELEIIVKSTVSTTSNGTETIVLYITERNGNTFVYKKYTCALSDSVCTTTIAKANIPYLYNTTYNNELVIRYNNVSSDGTTELEESITKPLTIVPKKSISSDLCVITDGNATDQCNNQLASDKDILLVKIKNADKLRSDIENSKEEILQTIFGSHYASIVDKNSISTFASKLYEAIGNGCDLESSNVCTVQVGIKIDEAQFMTGAPIPEDGFAYYKVIVYNYAPGLDTTTQNQNVTTCEYGSECSVSELSFVDYTGNSVENVETIITYNGEEVDGVDTTKLGSYVVTTYAIDKFGNRSMNIVRTYNIIDTIAPTIEISDEVIFVEKGESIKDIKLKAYDNYDEDVTVEILTNDVNFNKKGTYRIAYKATDSSGNTTIVYGTVVVKNTTEIVLYVIVALLSLIILVMVFMFIKTRKKINV